MTAPVNRVSAEWTVGAYLLAVSVAEWFEGTDATMGVEARRLIDLYDEQAAA